MIKKLLSPLILLFAALNIQAQSELTLPWLESVYQSSYINPVSMPDHKLSIGLPGISGIRAGITNSGFTFNNLVKERTDTALHLSINQVIDKVRRKNFIYAGTSIDLFHIRVKAKNMFFSFHVNENVNVRFAYPKDLIQLPWKGNGEYIGEKVDLSGLAFDATHHREYALGFMKYDDKKPLSFGGRLKLLQGLANVNWKNKELSLETSPDMYHLDVKSDGIINTSLPVSINEDSTYTTTDAVGYFTNFQNKGFALDFGAEYKYNEKLTFSAAASNIGFIKWKTNPNNYKIEGGTYFNGFNPVDELYTDSTAGRDIIDSIGSHFNYQKTQESYTTWLAPRLYLSAKYKLLPKTEVGGAIFLEKFQTIRPGITLALNQKAGKVFEGVLTYSVQYRSWSNIGVGVMVKPGPVQLYFATDAIRFWTINEIGDNSITLPMNARFLNFRFGINLVFGRIRTADRQPLPEDLK